ncbi:hypothetical protein GGR56DRAFT_689087 [Xylariaceae sp. FL0804]|nr:hypothetical protein GGR56DRAFT_689087 [Xylariaceae sp. FL0804]
MSIWIAKIVAYNYSPGKAPKWGYETGLAGFTRLPDSTTYPASELYRKYGFSWRTRLTETWRIVTDTLRGPRAHLDGASGLRKRTAIQQQNRTIGIVVGILLGVFLVAVIWFLYVYRYSIRCSRRKKHRHRRSGGTKGSHSSQSSGGGGGGGEGEAA